MEPPRAPWGSGSKPEDLPTQFVAVCVEAASHGCDKSRQKGRPRRVGRLRHAERAEQQGRQEGYDCHCHPPSDAPAIGRTFGWVHEFASLALEVDTALRAAGNCGKNPPSAARAPNQTGVVVLPSPMVFKAQDFIGHASSRSAGRCAHFVDQNSDMSQF